MASDRARAEDVARKIKAMVDRPVDDLDREMRLRGFGPEHRAIVFEALMHSAHIAVLRARSEDTPDAR